MATNFTVKMGVIGRLIFIRRLATVLAFQNVLVYCQSGLRTFIVDDLATLCVNLVNFYAVTPEFKIGKDVHPVVFSLK